MKETQHQVGQQHLTKDASVNNDAATRQQENTQELVNSVNQQANIYVTSASMDTVMEEDTSQQETIEVEGKSDQKDLSVAGSTSTGTEFLHQHSAEEFLMAPILSEEAISSHTNLGDVFFFYDHDVEHNFNQFITMDAELGIHGATQLGHIDNFNENDMVMAQHFTSQQGFVQERHARLGGQRQHIVRVSTLYGGDDTLRPNLDPIGLSETIIFPSESSVRERSLSANYDSISTGQTVISNVHSPVIFPGTEEEGHDNDWYDSIVRDAQREEEMEDPELYRISLEQHTKEFKASKENESHHSMAKEDRATFSIENISKSWDLHKSELNSEETSPSTKRQSRVPPLADDDTPKFSCGICLEILPIFDIFHRLQCAHKFCVQCMTTYIEGKIHAGEVLIMCPHPECKGKDNGLLHPEDCKKSIDFAAFSNWGDRLTEHAIPPTKRIYCPNRECRTMLESTCANTPSMVPCPSCNHQMCSTCGLVWSIDGNGQHDCAKGQEATLVMKLATECRWKQCPRCKMLVERTVGCNVMHCRCRFIFCYKCGRPMVPGEGEMCRCWDKHAPLHH